MSGEWAKLEGEQKEKFDRLCAEDKERYNKEMVVYREKKKVELAKEKRK